MLVNHLLHSVNIGLTEFQGEILFFFVTYFSILLQLEPALQKMLTEGKSSPQKTKTSSPQDFRKFLKEKKTTSPGKSQENSSDNV
jgi:hypothetical protein